MARPRPHTGFAAQVCSRFFVLVSLLLVSLNSAAFAAGSLSGRVVDPSGRPVPTATVLLDGPLGVQTATTDANGQFTFDGLIDIDYRITVEAAGFSAPPQIIRAGARPATLEMRLQVAPYSESVVVAGSPVPRPLSEAPASTSVIAATELAARQLENVADALRTTPGFAVGRNGGRGALTSVFPRGGESDYTLVLVDGVRLNNFGGGFDFSLLPLGDVEQVEVVRGPQSAIFGADAIGGVVHLTTRRGAPGASAQLEGGGEATLRALASARATIREWSAGVSAEHNQSDGFTGIAPATGETVSNDDWTQSLGQAHIGWTRNAFTAVRADVRWIDAERGSPGPYGSNPIGAYTAVDRVSRGEDTQRQIGLDGRLPWGAWLPGRIVQRWQVTVADLDNRYHSSFGDSFFETRRASVRTQTDMVLTSATGLTTGVEAFSERAESTYITGEQFEAVPIERRTIGVFGEVRHDLGARASVSAGVRFDDIRRDGLAGDPNPFGPRPRFDAESVTSINPRLAARLVAWQDSEGRARTTVRAGFGTGIRPADAFEIAFTDNPSLEPERSRSLDFGISHVVRPDLTVGLTAFFNDYDDLIVAVGGSFDDVSRYRTDNISNARARGVELEGAWRGGPGFHARVAYTWLDTEILAVDQTDAAPPPFAVGDPLIRRPRHQGSLDTGWARGPLSAFATLRVRGEVLDVEPSFGSFGGLFEAPGFTVLDAGASWRVARQVEIFGRGLNLLDRRYEEAFGFPAPGRLGMIGLRVDLRP